MPSSPERPPVNRQRVYRAGLMVPSPDAGAAFRVSAAADGRRMGTAHPTRLGSLFAAPTLPGVVRWVLGKDMCRYETRVREITIDADTARVYRVQAWERIRDEHDTAGMDRHWATGMTLAQWHAVADEQGLDAADWEVPISPHAVLGHRNVSPRRLLAAAPEWREPELRRIVRHWRHAA